MRLLMTIEGVVAAVVAAIGSVMAIYTATGTTIATIGIAGMFLHALYLTIREL